MAVDFAVIIRVRQRFGDFQPDVSGLEMNAPWVGEEKEFAFQCPNVDSSKEAVLLFQAQGAPIAPSRSMGTLSPARFTVASM